MFREYHEEYELSSLTLLLYVRTNGRMKCFQQSIELIAIQLRHYHNWHGVRVKGGRGERIERLLIGVLFFHGAVSFISFIPFRLIKLYCCKYQKATF